MDEQPAWMNIAAATQSELLSKIPKEWLLQDDVKTAAGNDVSEIPQSCGVLSATEIEMTTLGDATSLLQQLHSGEWTAHAVMTAFCKRAAVAQQLVNCLMSINFENAIEEAKELDRRLKETGTPVGPLHGLPISIKDHLHVAGHLSTGGYCCLADNIPDEDAVLVKALKNAGAIVFVKTTQPATGMVFETVSSLFGRTVNPFNRRLTCGGSSGGEGALVGLRASPMGIGSDIGGSIRIPCAFNGLYGIRPTCHRLSLTGSTGVSKGKMAIAATAGPMGHSIRDLELICKVATDAEPWSDDPGIIPLPWQQRPSLGRKLVIGVMTFDGVVRPHPPVLGALNKAAESLRAAGHDVFTFEPYEHQRCWNIYYSLMYCTAGKEFASALAKTGEPWPPAAKKLSAKPGKQELSLSELFQWQAASGEYKAEYLKHWNSTTLKSKSGIPMDALLCPVAPSASFPHDFFPWWGYTSQFNLLDYPSVVLPAGFVDKSRDVKDTSYEPANDLDRENHDLYDPEIFHNAPLSIQLVGKAFEDEKLLAIAAEVDSLIHNN